MNESEAKSRMDRHVHEALVWIEKRRESYPCAVRGGCHVLFIVDESASLFAALRALVREQSYADGRFIAILPIGVAEWLLAAHGLDAEPVTAAADDTGESETLIVGVVDGFLMHSKLVPPRVAERAN